MRRFDTVVKADGGPVLDLLGPTIEFLTSEEDSFCIMKGTIPPGVNVPLHSHEDAESFYLLSGDAQVFVEIEGRLVSHTLKRGDFVQIPNGAKHAWRNASHEPIEALAGKKLVLEAKQAELPSKISSFELGVGEMAHLFSSLPPEVDTTELAEQLAQVRAKKQPELEAKRLRTERDQFRGAAAPGSRGASAVEWYCGRVGDVARTIERFCG
jgi:quercetin dioxygenase-like cupin family protein